MKRKYKKKTLIQKLEKELDEAWSLLVKLRANNKCEYCKKGEGQVQIQSHHIYGRRNRSVRWEVVNGVCLCASHHTLDTRFSAHATPIEFDIWLRKTKGNNFIDRLRFKAHQTSRLHPFEKQLLLEALQREIHEYELKIKNHE